MIPPQANPEPTNPIFPGGPSALQRYVDQSKQPLPVTTNGTVFIEFVVNADGSVSDFVVLKGLGLEADQEAIHIVSTMPSWIPGTVNGEPASFKFVLPISFDAME